MEHGKLVMDAKRLFATQTPVVKLGDHFKKLSNFQKRCVSLIRLPCPSQSFLRCSRLVP